MPSWETPLLIRRLANFEELDTVVQRLGDSPTLEAGYRKNHSPRSIKLLDCCGECVNMEATDSFLPILAFDDNQMLI